MIIRSGWAAQCKRRPSLFTWGRTASAGFHTAVCTPHSSWRGAHFHGPSGVPWIHPDYRGPWSPCRPGCGRPGAGTARLHIRRSSRRKPRGGCAESRRSSRWACWTGPCSAIRVCSGGRNPSCVFSTWIAVRCTTVWGAPGRWRPRRSRLAETNHPASPPAPRPPPCSSPMTVLMSDVKR